jgi:hypothetical protein
LPDNWYAEFPCVLAVNVDVAAVLLLLVNVPLLYDSAELLNVGLSPKVAAAV